MTETRSGLTPANSDLDFSSLTQAAMSAYVDGAQAGGHAHDRLVRASRGAAEAVVGQLREAGFLRFPLEQAAAHGTTGGYKTGCRCEFCVEAVQVFNRSRYRWNQRQGHNKVGGAA